MILLSHFRKLSGGGAAEDHLTLKREGWLGMRKKVKLSKQVPVIESFFILALIYQLEKKWEENTRLQDEKKRSEILIQDLRENLQHLEQESTPMSNCRIYPDICDFSDLHYRHCRTSASFYKVSS